MEQLRRPERWGATTDSVDIDSAGSHYLNDSNILHKSADVDDPHEILGVSPEASEAVVEAAARQRLKETHPDQGGDRREHQCVQEARSELRG